MVDTLKKFLTINTFLWLLYLGLLAVLLPHLKWAAMQVEPATSEPVAWAFAVVFEGAVAGFTYALKKRIENMPRIIHTRKARMNERLRWWPVFQYRYINLTALGLFVMVFISGFGNIAHALEYADQNLVILKTWNLPFSVYALVFGGVLPLANMLFTSVLADTQDTEQDSDLELDKTKAELREANKTIREKEQIIQAAERRAIEAEQQLKGVGNLIRYMFDKDAPLRDRIRGLALEHPDLSQNRIAGIIGCSTDTVNRVFHEMETTDHA
jgi:hypothetical protein